MWMLLLDRYHNLQMKSTLLLLTLLVAVLSIDYCQTDKSKDTLFLTADELRTINLNDYVKGYDLVFSSEETKEAKIFNSLDTVEFNPSYLEEDSTLRSIDIKKSPHFHGLGHGAVLFQSSSGTLLSLWTGDVKGEDFPPDFSDFRNYTLPTDSPANCWDARVINDDIDVFINCQTTPNKTEVDPMDLFCVVKESDLSLQVGKNCQLLPYFMVSLQRRTRLLTIGDHLFVLSANNDVTQKDDPLSYVSVHYYNKEGKFVFANIIDASQTANPQLEITDIVLAKESSIIVADAKHSRLIYYRYDVANTYQVTKEIKISASPLSLGYSIHQNTLMVGTSQQITQYPLGSSSVLNKYATDPSDSHVSQIQFTEEIVAFRTSNSHLHIYDRRQHKINELRRRVDMDANTGFFISSSPNDYVFTLDFNISSQLYAGAPFLEVGSMTKNLTLDVVAESQEVQCMVKIKLVLIQDVERIITKDNLATKSFKVDPQQGLTLKLDRYFGGANLRYSIPDEAYPVDFDVEVKHFKNYPFTPTFATTDASTVLHINENQFYFVGINSLKEGAAYVDICKFDSDQLAIKCEFWAKINSISAKRGQISTVSAATRSDGTSHVMWNYQDTSIVESIQIEKKLVSFFGRGDDFTYDSIHIGDSFDIKLSKTGRRIDISFEVEPYFADITDGFFTDQQLLEVEYFYPRSIYFPNVKSRIFYVQFPTKIAEFAILNNHKIEYRGIVAKIDGYRPSSEWTYLFPNNHRVSLVDGTLTEETYNPFTRDYAEAQELESSLGNSPLKYDTISGVITQLSSADKNGQKTLKILRPFQGSLDLQYYEVVLDGEPVLSGNWLLNDGSSNAHPSVFYVDKSPQLFATSHIPEDMFKEDVTISLNVDSKTAHETASTEIEGVNFPVNIKDHPSEDIVQIPDNATNQEIPLHVDYFFNGSIQDYQLQCPYCYDGRIKLLTPFRHPKTLSSVHNAVDFVETSQSIITLSQNVLYMMNQKLDILSIELIPKESCTNLEYNDAFGVFVYCIHNGQQQVLLYSADLNEFTYLYTYTIPAAHAIQNFDEMFAVVVDGHSFVLFLDNDEDIDSNDKQSSVKVFQIANQDLMFKEEWTSSTFKVHSEDILPINDLDIFEQEVYVTIGDYGIGYGALDSDGTVAGPGSLSLAVIPDIKNILIDDSYFKQVEVLGKDEHKRQFFISSTSSLSFVATFTESDTGMIFYSLDEVYLRYGNQRLLNWHHVSNSYIFLSYYKEAMQEASIVYYSRQPRQLFAPRPFSIAQRVRVPKSKLKYHEAYVTQGDKLLISHLSETYGDGELVALSIENGFSLALNYEKSGDFDHIDVLAYNSYKNATHTQKVEFKKKPGPEPTPDPDPSSHGLKWYVVMIIVLVVLIISGAAYGLYRYVRAKREKKSVSLLTEKEEGADEEGDRGEMRAADSPINDSEVVQAQPEYKAPLEQVAEEEESRDSINRD